MVLIDKIYSTRERWLFAAMQQINIQVFNKSKVTSKYWRNFDSSLIQYHAGTDEYRYTGVNLFKTKVTCGYSPTGNTGRRKIVLGSCFAKAASENYQYNEIFISPVESDTVKILDTLTHEMVHAIDDCKNGHNTRFWALCCDIGLDKGKPTTASANDDLIKKLKSIAETLGEYPHDAIRLNNKPQSTRNIKVSCDSCDFSYRTSRKNINMIQDNSCPTCCGGYMTWD